MYEIAKETKDKIKSCPKWRICLSGDLSFCCQVIELKDTHLIVEPTKRSCCGHCIFHIRLSGENKTVDVCFCPLRKEIYAKYNA